MSPIACMVCTVDPATTSMLLPLAQATIISAPIIFRKQIGRAVRAARGKRARSVDEASRRVDGETPVGD